MADIEYLEEERKKLWAKVTDQDAIIKNLVKKLEEAEKQIKENVQIPVIGNGDIKTIYDAKRMLEETKCDAVMIGRATLGNPWIIKECVEYIEHNNIISKPTSQEKLEMIIKHYNLLKQNTNEKQALLEIRSHALWYIKGLTNNKKIKLKIMESKTEEEFIKIIKEYMEEIK